MGELIPEREARLRNLIAWLRNRDWAPAGADLCADDIEALLAAPAPPDLESRVKMLEDCVFGRLTYSSSHPSVTVHDHKDPAKVVGKFSVPTTPKAST